MTKVVPATPSYAVQQPPSPRVANYYLSCGSVTLVLASTAATLPASYALYVVVLVVLGVLLASASDRSLGW